MKISKILMMAAVMVIAVAVFSCKEDAGLSAPGVAKVSELQALPAGVKTAVLVNDKKENEIKDLLDSALGSYKFRNMLNGAFEEAYFNVISTTNTTAPDRTSKSLSYNVKINDTEELKKASGAAIASITGNVKETYSASKPELLWSHDYKIQDGDSISDSGSGKITYKIADGWFKIENYDNDYYISGIITIEENGSSKVTVKDAIKNDYESSGNSTTKVAITVAIYSQGKTDKTKMVGAKFTLSGSTQNSTKYRSANYKLEEVCSDILVYSDAGALTETIRGSDAEDYLSGFSFLGGSSPIGDLF